MKKIYPDEGMDEIRKKLKEKEAELEALEAELKHSEALNTTLFVRERQSNSELQEARKELISVCFCVFIHFVIVCLNTRCIHYYMKVIASMYKRARYSPVFSSEG